MATDRLWNSMSAMAFSPDSRVVALEGYFKSHAGSVALIEVASGRDWRRSTILMAPEPPDRIQPRRDAVNRHAPRSALSPDLGSSAVRRRLAELGLDWNPPAAWRPSAPSLAPDFTPRPLPYRVDRGQLDLWLKQSPIRRPEQAIADAEMLYTCDPGQAEVPRVAGRIFQQPCLGADRRDQIQARPVSCSALWLAGPLRWHRRLSPTSIPSESHLP